MPKRKRIREISSYVMEYFKIFEKHNKLNPKQKKKK